MKNSRNIFPLPTLFPIFAAAWIVSRWWTLQNAGASIFSFDEYEIGTVAKELLDGLKMPYWKYQIDAYSGESLFLAPFLLLLFQVLGPSLLALKLLPVLFSFLTFCASWGVIKRFWGIPSAVWSALFLIFPPIYFLELNFLAMSGHTEILLLMAVGMGLFFSLMEEKNPKTFTKLNIALSFLCGFSIWVYYENLIFSAAFLISFFFRRIKSGWDLKQIVFSTLSFLAGFAPWIAYNALHQGAGISFFSEASTVLHHQGARVILKGVRFLFLELPEAFHVNVPRLKNFPGYILILFFLGLPISYLIHNRISRKSNIAGPAFFYVYGLLFFVFYALTPVGIQPGTGAYGYRYLAPLYYALCLLAGIILGRIRFRIACFIVFPILTLLAAGQISLVGHRSGPADLTRYKGYSYYHFATPLHLSGAYRTLSFDDWLNASLKFSPEARFFLYWGMFDQLASFNQPYFLNKEGTQRRIFSILHEEEMKFYYFWLGSVTSPDSPQKTADALKAIPPKERFHYLFSWAINRNPNFVGDEILALFTSEDQRALGLAHGMRLYNEQTPLPASSHPNYVRWALRGMGAGFAQNKMTPAETPADAFISRTLNTFSQDQRREFFRGFGWGARLLFRDDRTRAMGLLAPLVQSDHSEALIGFIECETLYEIPKSA